MERMKTRFSQFQYRGLVAIVLVFALIAVILFFERSGIQYQYNTLSLEPMSKGTNMSKAEALKGCETECLVLYASDSADSMEALEEFNMILTDMKVGYDAVELSEAAGYRWDDYSTVILLVTNLSTLGDRMLTLDEWVYNGGSVLFPLVLEKEQFFSVMETKFGILESSYENARVDTIHVSEDFMIGSGKDYEITDPWDSALTVQLEKTDRVTVYACTADDRQIPLIWETKYGAGKFVFDNFGIYTKGMRGLYCASYTLLKPVTVYPVINGSCFYLDDFPSQVPSGSNEYVWRDYGTTIRDFYTNIWWPDMMNLADQYHLKYTGLAIQCYDDSVDGTTESLADTRTFLYFGNMLLRQGGEIGYHGYNHQPLALDDCDYLGYYDYKTWESEAAMKSGLDTLMELCDELFPGVNMTVYVPPSNIMSEGAEAFLIREYPNIKSISGTYFESLDIDFYCVQEFDVLESGVVEQPRIISGCNLDPYMELAAFSELNFHYVNSHFTHPDDSLDPDRGAELGWETLKSRFTEYLDWLYGSAPNIRNLTGTEMASAVERFAAISVSTVIGDDKMEISIGNFYDEAQLMVRFNERRPAGVEGGTLEQLTDTLYLLQADSPEVTITFAPEGQV